MVDWRIGTNRRKIQQEIDHGKKASPSTGDAGGDIGTAADHVPSVWKSNAHGPPQSSQGDHLSRSHTADPESVSVPQSSLPPLPPADAPGRGRWMGVASWGIWPGC